MNHDDVLFEYEENDQYHKDHYYHCHQFYPTTVPPCFEGDILWLYSGIIESQQRYKI